MHTARVAQPYAGGQVLQAGLHMVGAGRQGLYDADGAHQRQRAHTDPGGLHVGHDVEAAVGRVGGELLAAVPEEVARPLGKALDLVRRNGEPYVSSGHAPEASSEAGKGAG
ncbi:hypothetical protein GCM10023238_16390 [Streptomyces heliomycini]